MGFATRKRLFRHMAFAHNVDPQAEFDNEESRDLILNPPTLDPSLATGDKKSRRGRRKGAKNRLKLDPDTGQMVRTLWKAERKKKYKTKKKIVIYSDGKEEIVTDALDVKETTKLGKRAKKLVKNSASANAVATVAASMASMASAVASASGSSVDENAVAAAAILLNEHNAASLWWPQNFSSV